MILALKEFKTALQQVAPLLQADAAGGRASFRLAFEEDRLSVMGTNGNDCAYMWVSTSGGYAGEEAWLPAKLLDFVSSLQGDELELELGNTLNLTAGPSSAKFAIERIPFAPMELGPEVAVSLDAALLQRLCRGVYACSQETFRDIFQSLALEGSEAGLRSVCTDGYRLHIEKEPRQVPKFTFLLHRKRVGLLQRFMRLGGSGVVLRIGRSLRVEGSNWALDLALSDGEPIDPDKVTPKTKRVSFFWPPEATAALKRMEVFATRENRKVRFSVEGTELHLSAENELGKASETVQLEVPVSEPFTCDINVRYLSESLMEGAVLELNEPAKPFVVTFEGGYAVLVPLRS